MLLVFIYSFCAIAISVESNMAVNNSFIFEQVRSSHHNLVIDSPVEFKNQLAFYRAFYIEGENLKNFCAASPKVYYKNRFEKNSVATSIAATLQWSIIKNTIGAIRSYTKALEISDSGYEQIGKNLISSSCSQNISVVSHRRLTKMFKDTMTQPDYELPDISNNPFYTSKITKRQSKQEILARELYYTLGLFKVACSWGQDVDYLRGLEGLIKNPIIASYLMRQMSGLEIQRKINAVELGLATSDTTTRVHCDNLICREKSGEIFEKEFPKSIGQQSVLRDLKSVYCQNIYYKTPEIENELDDSVKQVYANYLDDESYRLIGQYIALITKIPDFNVWTDNKQILGEYIRDGLEHFWDGWSKKVIKNQVENISYEEPLVLDVVDHKIFLPVMKSKPHVQLDLNSGEFDKVIAINGKIKYKFDVEFLERDLLWLYFKYKNVDPSDVEENQLLDNLLTQYINKNFSRIKSEFSNYLISGDIVNLIKEELKNQLKYIVNIDLQDSKELIKIPVDINISPFALVYLKNKHIMQGELQAETATNDQFKSLNRIDAMASEAK